MINFNKSPGSLFACTVAGCQARVRFRTRVCNVRNTNPMVLHFSGLVYNIRGPMKPSAGGQLSGSCAFAAR